LHRALLSAKLASKEKSSSQRRRAFVQSRQTPVPLQQNARRHDGLLSEKLLKSVFSYDGMGRRTVDAETIGGVTTTTRYLWCDDRICQVRDGSDAVLKRDLDEGELNVATGQKLIYMPDQLSSVRDVLDGTTGNLVQSFDYSPYGAITQSNGSTPTDYQYAGLFYHTQSALYLATHRAYDPVAFHFPNRDPLAERGGANPYAYAGADPVDMFDPWGLAQCQYSISTHTLDCVSNAGGDVNTVGPSDIFSGRGMCANNNNCYEQSGIGPIVPGNYNMNQDTRPGHEGFWRLEPNPKIPAWKYYMGLARNGFELHPGGRSAGCITVNKKSAKAMDQYNKVNSLLQQENGSNQLTVGP
jgi:RHS repeat-associated protein